VEEWSAGRVPTALKARPARSVRPPPLATDERAPRGGARLEQGGSGVVGVGLGRNSAHGPWPGLAPFPFLFYFFKFLNGPKMLLFALYFPKYAF
jgi:hypothetical protein